MNSNLRPGFAFSRFRFRRKLNKKHRQQSLGLNCLIYFILLCSFALFYKNSNHRRNLGQTCDDEEGYEGSDFIFEEYFTKEQLRSGAVCLHVIGILYAFVGLAIICDDYFEPCLEVLCKRWKLTPDVAGATFMAAAGSAPELATSLSGVFFAKSDIGFGTILGSAVFNMLFVIAVCGVVAPGLTLTWWPLSRDSIFYSFSILVLALVVVDSKVTLVEASLLFGIYFVYILIMKYNDRLHHFVEDQLRVPVRAPWRLMVRVIINSAFFKIFMLAVIVMNFIFTLLEVLEGGSPEWSEAFNTTAAILFVVEYVLKSVGLGFFSYWVDIWNAIDGALVFLVVTEWLVNASIRTAALRIVRLFKIIRMLRAIRIISSLEQTHDQLVETLKREDLVQNLLSSTEFSKEESYHEMESDSDISEDDNGPSALLDFGETKSDFAWWFVTLPFNLLYHSTVPDSTQDHLEKFFPISFVMSLVWIIIISYFMVFMATTVGDTLGIPPPIMGLTLLAAGTSITDLLTSRAVAARGFGDMAVSSSIGSNIFDILVGLGLPWLVFLLIIDYNSVIEIKSQGLVLMVIGLLLMVGFVFLFIHYYGWTLNQNLAYTFVGLYFVYVAFDLTVEYGWLFGCDE